MSEQTKEQGITRRQFLKSLGAGLGLTLLGSPITRGIETVTKALGGSPAKKVELPKLAVDLSPEQRQMLVEIGDYRKVFGLSPYPTELELALENPNYPWKWNLHFAPTKNQLPITLKTYGIEAIKVLKSVYGPRATHLIRNINLSKKIPGGFGYDGTEYALVFPYDIKNVLEENPLPDLILHEGAGHGSDPSYDDIRPKNLYPKDVLLAVEHGKWRMLSRAFNIPGQFLNHPEDGALPSIKKFIGESLLEKINQPGALFFKNRYTLFLIQNALKDSQSENLSSALTSDEALMSFGGKVFDLFRQGRLQFMEEYAGSLEQAIDDNLDEIYAEMIKMAIFHPGKIGYNREIMAGCQEIVEAVRGEKVNLQDIRASLLTILPKKL